MRIFGLLRCTEDAVKAALTLLSHFSRLQLYHLSISPNNSDLLVMYSVRLARHLVRLALDEDLSFGDLSSSALSDPRETVRARVLAAERTVVCGLELAQLIIDEYGDRAVSSSLKMRDGEEAQPEDCLLELQGPVASLLSIERILLNFLQRLSGIALHTRGIVSQCPELTVLDTRKTTPGWRVLEKYAVRIGGGGNHRLHLGDMVMLKNNHLDVSESALEELFLRLRAQKPFYTPIQVEVRSLDELKRVIPFEPDSVLLDNLTTDEIRDCLTFLKQSRSECSAEISGRIEPSRFRELVEVGVRTVSTSFLIHGSRPSDIRMRIFERSI